MQNKISKFNKNWGRRNSYFFWEDQSLKVRIRNIRYYKTLKEMISNENVDRLVPGMSYQNALREYESIYPEWKVVKFNGLIVFEFEII